MHFNLRTISLAGPIAAAEGLSGRSLDRPSDFDSDPVLVDSGNEGQGQGGKGTNGGGGSGRPLSSGGR